MKGNIKLFVMKMLATFFFSGLSPKAPGTVGSFFAVLFYLALMQVLTRCELILLTFVIFIVGWYCSSFLIKALGGSDPQIIVIDEVAGVFVTMNMIPLIYMDYPVNLAFAGICFVLFRFFDIVKPFPVSWADTKVKGGLGVMLDDVLAGVYAGFVIWIGAALYRVL